MSNSDTEYEVIQDRRIVVERFRGRVGMGEAKAMIDAVNDNPQTHPDMDTLVDLTEATVDLSFDEMIEFVDHLSETRGKSTRCVAFVVTKPLNLGMAKMFQGLADGLLQEVGYFDNEPAALAWLDEVRAVR